MSTRHGFSTSRGDLDKEVRLFVYRQTVRTGQVLAVVAIAKGLNKPLQKVKAALRRLSASHAFVLQKASGELWRLLQPSHAAGGQQWRAAPG